MSHSSQMILQLQAFQRNSKVYNQIFNVEGLQFGSRDEAIEDLKLQLVVDTATWGLEIYESELDIVTDNSKPLLERRSVIKSKMRGTGQVNSALIKLVSDSYTNGDVDVLFDGSIIVKFVSVKGVPPNIEDLEKVIDDIKPAHLNYSFVFTYNTYQYVSQFTHDDLSNYTHNEIREVI